MARVMFHAKTLPCYFRDEVENTSCYIHNRVTICPRTKITHYELWKGRKPNVKYFHMFGSKCYVLIDREKRRKMDPMSDQGIFLGYAVKSMAYHVYNTLLQ